MSMKSNDFLLTIKNIIKKVETPSCYLGTEVGSVHKDLNKIKLHYLLCFPSTYEIGMSFTGFQILYQMINRDERIFAERAYLPKSDMIALLKEKDLPLFSLESKTPVNKFDIVAISLQYELSILGILEILSLSKIPLLSKDRDESAPLIIAGGPLCYNPLPFSDFFDAFFVGDAEDTYMDFLDSIIKLKEQGKNRDEILKEISKIDGVYVPKYYENNKKIKRQIAKDFSKISPFINPVIPFCEIVHNRLAIEIQRGCVRGCRFCQAGFMYRPVREKTAMQNLNEIISAIKNTGFEEVSLLSLSTADYSNIIYLLKMLKNSLSLCGETTLSFPSTRVDKLGKALLNEVQVTNRKSFTIAPEGGTQRIRNIINKGVTEEQIFTACENAFSLGWKSLKMYFMIGLPFETDEDVLGIAELAIKIKNKFRGKKIVVSVSSFVPKTHTPFERCEQIDTEEVFRRQELLFSRLREHKIDYRFNKAFTASLEGLVARGDNNLADLFLEVFKNYPKEEITKEFINREIWEEALEKTNISLNYYLRERKENEELPWKIIDTGLNESFLKSEFNKAKIESLTLDCKKHSCSGCGVCMNLNVKNIIENKEDENLEEIEEKIKDIKSIFNFKPKEENKNYFVYRLRFQKINLCKHLSYFEVMGVFTRALRRTDLPLVYSAGFTPRIHFSFSPPVQVGIESKCEFLDLTLHSIIKEDELLEKINKELISDLSVLEVKRLDNENKKVKSIQSEMLFVEYLVKNNLGVPFNLNTNLENIFVEKKQNRKTYKVAVTNYLEVLENNETHLKFKLKMFEEAMIKPKDAFNYLTGLELKDFDTIKESVTLEEN